MADSSDIEITPAARLWALEKAFINLAANVFSPAQLDSIAADFRQKANRLVEAPQGSVMLPSARSDETMLAAGIQTATAVLYECAADARREHDRKKAAQ